MSYQWEWFLQVAGWQFTARELLPNFVSTVLVFGPSFAETWVSAALSISPFSYEFGYLSILYGKYSSVTCILWVSNWGWGSNAFARGVDNMSEGQRRLQCKNEIGSWSLEPHKRGGITFSLKCDPVLILLICHSWILSCSPFPPPDRTSCWQSSW